MIDLVADHSADPTGATSSQTAFEDAIDQAANRPYGGIIYAEGIFLADEIPPLPTNVQIVGGGRGSWIKATTGGVQLVRVSGDNGGVSDITLDGNNKANVQLLSVVPEDESDDQTIVSTSFNTFKDLWLRGGAEGLVLRGGPHGSSCYYNNFDRVFAYYCDRGIWLRDAVTDGVDPGTPPNRNRFVAVRVGNGINTGLQIDSGDTNRFVASDFEGVNDGTSPSSTPTAVKVANVGAQGLDNAYNRFIGCSWEGCTRDMENHNTRTELALCNIAQSKITGTAAPAIQLGADISLRDMLIPGMRASNSGIMELTLPTQVQEHLFSYVDSVAIAASESNKTIRDLTAADNGSAWRVFIRMLGEFKIGYIYKNTTGALTLYEEYSSGNNFSWNVSGQLLRASNAVASPRTIVATWLKIA